jgi:hypothetical protein
MSSVKPYTEVKSLVKSEIDSIKKREGELPPGAYIVLEVATRLKTLTPWEGYDKAYPLARNLRKVVEDILHGVPVPGVKKKEENIIPLSKDPYDNLEDSLGDIHLISRSVDSLPSSVAKREKLKKKLRQAG